MNIKGRTFYCLSKGYKIGDMLRLECGETLEYKINQAKKHYTLFPSQANRPGDMLEIVYTENDIVKRILSLREAERILKLVRL
jgi:hypothetical protein